MSEVERLRGLLDQAMVLLADAVPDPEWPKPDEWRVNFDAFAAAVTGHPTDEPPTCEQSGWRRLYGPHRGATWSAQLGERRVTFVPMQVVGGRKWSVSLLLLRPVPVADPGEAQ